MDITQQLDALTEEALSFANAIDNHEADNLDLLNACGLFSQYLDDQLHQIDQVLENNGSLRQINTCQHLHRLHELITPVQNINKRLTPWKTQLDDFMLEAKILKQQAA